MRPIGIIRDRQSRMEEYMIMQAAIGAGVELHSFIAEELVLSADLRAIRGLLGELGAVLMRLQSGRTRYLATRAVEASGYSAINTSTVQAYSRDKFLTYLTMNSSNIPSPIACLPLYTRQFLRGNVLGVRRALVKRLTEKVRDVVGDMPLIQKPIDGTHGRNVKILSTDREILESLERRSAMDHTVLQPFYNSSWEVRAVSIKYPGSEPDHLVSIAKCATEPQQGVRNLAVTGVPVLIEKHKLIERLEESTLTVLCPKPHDYIITGNDWTPLNIPDSEIEKMCDYTRKLLPLYQSLKTSRQRLSKEYRRLYGSSSSEHVRRRTEAESAHERLVSEYLSAGEHEAIQSMIVRWLDSKSELLLLDINDNQDFPNVRDLTQRHLEDDYMKLAQAVSASKKMKQAEDP